MKINPGIYDRFGILQPMNKVTDWSSIFFRLRFLEIKTRLGFSLDLEIQVVFTTC